MSIILVNSYITAPPPIITRIVYGSGYNPAKVTSTSTSYTQSFSLTTDESSYSAADHAGFWMGVVDNNNTTSDVRARIQADGVTKMEYNIESQDTTDEHAVGGGFGYAGVGADIVAVSAISGETTSTYGIAGRSINILRLESGDAYAEFANTKTVTSGAPASAVTLSIPSDGDYFIIASASIGAIYANVSIGVARSGFPDAELTQTVHGNTYGQDATSFVPYFKIQKATDLQSGDAVYMLVSGNGGTASIKHASIVALKVSNWENAYYLQGSEDGSRFAASGTSSTYVDFVDQPGNDTGTVFNITNPGNYHLMLASAAVSGAATNQSVYARLRNKTRNINYNVETIREPNSAGEEYNIAVTRYIQGFLTSNVEIAWQFKTENTMNVSLINPIILLLDTGVEAPPIVFVGGESSSAVSTLSLPGEVEPDDLVIIASVSDTVVQSHPTGWTALANTGSNTNPSLYISYKYMSDPPDTEVTGLSTTAAHIAMAFRGIDLNASNNAIAAVSAATTASGMPDPPAVSTNITGSQNIVVCIGGVDDDTFTDTTAPSGFTLTSANTYQSGGSAATVMGAFRNEAPVQAGFDPGAFGGSGNDTTAAFTILLQKTLPGI